MHSLCVSLLTIIPHFHQAYRETDPIFVTFLVVLFGLYLLHVTIMISIITSQGPKNSQHFTAEFGVSPVINIYIDTYMDAHDIDIEWLNFC